MSAAERARDSMSAAERARYRRHLALPEIGEAGQLRLRATSILLVGAGGLGSPAALYLAAAGVGRLGVADPDRVEVSNLQRQVLHSAASEGELKVESARRRLLELNPEIRVDAIAERITASNALRIVSAHDIVIDGTDGFPARYLLNDACILAGKPLVHGAIHRFDGQVSVFDPPRGPCYRCLHPVPPKPGLVQDCEEAGVLGVLPGIIGTLQAAEALKLALGIGEPLRGTLLLHDALAMTFERVAFARDPSCPGCGPGARIELRDIRESCAAAAGEIGAKELQAWLSETDLQLIDVRQPSEAAADPIEGARAIPLGELPLRLGELERERPVLLCCRSGARSLRAARELGKAGFPRAASLAGGIDHHREALATRRFRSSP